LLPHQKSFIYQLLALGTRKCVIVDKVNKNWGTGKSTFKKNHMAFYTNKWRGMSPEERTQHLPYSMEDSFATQEVRINDDIRQLQLTNHLIYLAENQEKIDTVSIANLQGVGIRLKNRIAQELGQVRAFAKGGVGNMNQVQIQLNQFNTLVSKVGSQKSPEERLKSLNKIYEAIDNADKSGKE